jgi:hypothetical protein
MPVDQTGENIVFVLDEGFVEAHIQIQVDPSTGPSQFAWIVPVTATPEFSVGSQQLFVDLLNATVPGFGVDRTWEECGWGSGDGLDGCDEGGEKLDLGQGAETSGGTEVILQETVGAFDVVVLQAGSAAELMTWLGDNGYDQDAAAEPILQQYVDEGFEFVALRLQQGADVGEIHPIVIRFAGSEACVPIRLTRIAASDDMDIRAMFLGDARVVSTNFQHVVVNDLQLDWGNLVPDWKQAVTLAIDEAQAGHAWVTEYAGASAVVPTDALWSEAWNAAPFETMMPVDAIDELGAQGLVQCANGSCEYQHPLVLGLLRQWLPAPVGVPEDEFYGCVACYAEQIDQAAWNGVELAQALHERIIAPGAHALEVVQSHPYLTRLYSTLSPAEMTEDPLFGENPDLPEVDLRSSVASVLERCDGREQVGLPSGRSVMLSGQTAWPDIAPGQMPFAERIEQTAVAGAPFVVVDNAMLIDELLAAWNAMNAHLGPQRSCHDDGAATSVSGGDFDGFFTVGDGDDRIDRGCGCRGGSTPAGLLTLFVIACARPRRARVTRQATNRRGRAGRAVARARP